MRYIAVGLLVIAGLVLIVGRFHPGSKSTHYNYSFYSQKQFFEDAYNHSQATIPLSDPPGGILVNHHLLAANFIAKAFNEASFAPPNSTVILLSPNHFDNGHGQIITSAFDWQTSYGILRTDKKLIDKLAARGLVNIDDRPFAKEHGVSGIVPFVKKSLPTAKVVPIIFKSTLTFEQVQKFAKDLELLLPQNSLIVASVDMSHYVAQDIAEKQDAETMQSLIKADPASLWKDKTDSPATMVTTLILMTDRGLKFDLLQTSSSALLTGTTDPLDNTSYITGYWRDEAKLLRQKGLK